MRTTRKLVTGAVLASAVLLGSAGAVAADIRAEPCPAGYTGVVVEADGHQAEVCQNILP